MGSLPPGGGGGGGRSSCLFIVISGFLLVTSFILDHGAMASASTLSFLVVGDWGSGDDPVYRPTQVAVADAMNQIAQRERIDFVVSVGDNFYEDGVSSVDDPKWNISFVNMYSGEALQKQWYQMLGNHDYRGNVKAQLDYKGDSRWYMPSRNYTFSLPVAAGIRATFIVIDTTPFVNEYYNYPQNEEMRAQLRDQHWEAQLEWVKEEFAKVPKKDWLIVFGHHPIFSGHVIESLDQFQGGYRELHTSIQPLLEHYQASAYIAGHVHDLEHATYGDVQYFISGGGSRVRLTPRSVSETPKSNFYHSGAGFMATVMGTDSLNATFYDENGSVLYTINVQRRERPELTLNFHLLVEWNSSLLLLLFILGLLNVGALIVMLVVYLRRRRQRRRSLMIPMRDLGGAHYEIGDDDDPEAHRIGVEEDNVDEEYADEETNAPNDKDVRSLTNGSNRDDDVDDDDDGERFRNGRDTGGTEQHEGSIRTE